MKKTSEKLKLRFNDCGFECEGDDGTLLDEVALLEDVVEAGRHLRKASPSSSFWQVKDHDKSWIWCWNELSDTAQQRVRQANICFEDALAKLEKQL